MVNIDSIFDLQSDAESKRGTWEENWEEIADYVLPRQSDFVSKKTPGERRTGKIYESTALISLERFAATVENLLTPRSQLWHSVKSVDDELNRIPEVARYFDQVRDILFRYRYSPKANYASQQHEVYMSLGAFGTGVLFIGEDVENKGLRYKSVHLSEMFFFENHVGIIDMAHRKFPMKARNIKKMFGEDNCPADVKKDIQDGNSEKEYEILHAVRPKMPEDNHTELEYASYYILCKTKEVITKSGYSSFPYAISRYVTSPNEIYGRSPAWTVLSDIKTLNQMRKITLRSAHKVTDPAILTTDDGWLDTTPGKVNPGMLDYNGRAMAQAFNSGARVDFGIEAENLVRSTVKDAFLSNLYEILMQRPQMTATEVMTITQERGVLLSPTMGRQQSEALGPQIAREIDILDNFGVLPPPPQELIDAEYEIEYDSPMSRAQKAEFAIGVQRTYEFATQVAGIDPTIFDNLDHRENLRIIAESNGMPQRGFIGDDAVKKKEAKREQEAMANAALSSAPELAGAIKDISQAQKLQSSVG